MACSWQILRKSAYHSLQKNQNLAPGMASLKQLAGQTVWYGLSNIAARLLNYLLTPLLTYILHTPSGQADYGEITVLYSWFAFGNVIFTYGMETGYFRFASGGEDKERLFQTSFGSLLVSTALFSVLLYLFRAPLADAIETPGHTEYITMAIIILAADTLAAIPFARLRQAGRPRRYALIRVIGILVNIILVAFFMAIAPAWMAKHPDTAYAHWYAQFSKPALVLLANVAGSVVTFLLLWKEWAGFRFRWDDTLWRRVMAYSAPFVIIGLGGMVNEVLNRQMLLRLLPADSFTAKREVAILGANIKIAIFIQLFIQAFRMAAEPFFFNQSADKNAPKTYARVMKWFVITLCIAFLFTALFLDVWKHMNPPSYHSGIGVVPILLYANLALGVYYNLSVWYKLTGHLAWGIGITLFGAVVTLVINIALIPYWGMWACAWGTFACYGSMMIISYVAGRKYFPVPYPTKKLLSYIGAITVLFAAQQGVYALTDSFVIRLASGLLLMGLFFVLVWRAERSELKNFPLIGKYIR